MADDYKSLGQRSPLVIGRGKVLLVKAQRKFQLVVLIFIFLNMQQYCDLVKKKKMIPYDLTSYYYY